MRHRRFVHHPKPPQARGHQAVAPPQATVDGLVCLDPAASNYNDAATTHVQSTCDYTVYGCMNTGALNYFAAAQMDTTPTSCVMAVEGCTVSSALNYNPLANVLTTCVRLPAAPTRARSTMPTARTSTTAPVSCQFRDAQSRARSTMTQRQRFSRPASTSSRAAPTPPRPTPTPTRTLTMVHASTTSPAAPTRARATTTQPPRSRTARASSPSVAA